MTKLPALGKGLSALIPDAPEPRAATLDAGIDELVPNVFQPRAQLDDDRLEELAQSIKANGLIQPILVRRNGERLEIIAGERRWRAARKAGLLRVPIAVRDVGPGEERLLLELALVENIQRENLNPIDEALAYRRLADEFELTQDAIAAAVGKDRATVANVLRLLKLPEELRADVASGALSMGHARALLALPSEREQLEMGRDVVLRGLSVRETELLVRSVVTGQPGGGAKPRSEPSAKPVDVHTRAAEERLRLVLGTRVRIVRRGVRGRIEVDFTSENELIRIFEALVGPELEWR